MTVLSPYDISNDRCPDVAMCVKNYEQLQIKVTDSRIYLEIISVMHAVTGGVIVVTDC